MAAATTAVAQQRAPAWEYARLYNGPVLLWSAGDSNVVVDSAFVGARDEMPREDSKNRMMTRGLPLLLRAMNRVGRDGWELVAVVQGREEYYLFKRRRP